MNKFGIFLAFFLSANFGYGQVSVGNAPSQQYSIEFAMIPNHAYNRSIQTYPYLSENFKTTFNANLLFNYHHTKRFIFQAGIQYKFIRLQVRDNFQFKEYTLENALVDSEGRPLTPYSFGVQSSFGDFEYLAFVRTDRLEDGDDFEEGDEIKFDVFFKENLSMIGIPIYVKAKFGKKKTRLSIKAGLAYNYFVRKKLSNELVTLYTNGAILVNDEIHHRLAISVPQVEKEFDQLKSGYLESILGVGLEHQIRENFFLIFEPMITSAVTPVMDTENVKTYHNSWALYVGLRYVL